MTDPALRRWSIWRQSEAIVRDNEDLPMRNPGATRPWQHVLDAFSEALAVRAEKAEAELAVDGDANWGQALTTPEAPDGR